MDDRYIFMSLTWNDSVVSQHFRALGDEFIRRGFRVVYLVDGCRTDVTNATASPAIYTWPSPRPVHRQDAAFLWRLFQEYQPVGLITQFGAVNLMLMLGRLAGVPVRVAWYRTVTDAIDIEAALPAWKINLLRQRKGLIYRLATAIVANSASTKQDLLRAFGVAEAKCVVFHNLMADPLEHRSPEDIGSESDRLIVCAGRLDRNKGQDVLIRALPTLVAQFSDLCVEFIGDGPACEDSQALAHALGVAQHCRFLGRQPHSTVLERMGQARVVVVPSRAEAFGTVNIEAMAMATPVVASAVGGITDVIRDGVDGYLVLPESPEALATAIARIISDDALYDRMSHSARLRFLEQFELSRNVSAFADWYLGQVEP